MKLCSCCKELLPTSSFSKARTMTVSDGLNIYCRKCIKEKKLTGRIKKQVEEGDFFSGNYLGMFIFGGDTYKRCSKCGMYCKVSEFVKDNTKRQGYGSTCISCERLRYKEKNAKNREYRNAREKRLRDENPNFTIRRRISDQVRKAINGKGGLSTFAFLPYTPEQLKLSLESKFKDGMTWGNYGDWHIDHIKPQSLFNIKELGDNEFLGCWSLDNLQPLWASENCSKGAKYDF